MSVGARGFGIEFGDEPDGFRVWVLSVEIRQISGRGVAVEIAVGEVDGRQEEVWLWRW